MNNRAHSSALELLQSTDCLLKQLPDARMFKETPHKEEFRLTSGAYHSGTKKTEETGSNPNGSAATTGGSPGKQGLE